MATSPRRGLSLSSIGESMRSAVRLLSGHLVAFYSGPARPEVLREALRHQLPEGLVPRSILPLPGLPRASSGKIDRAALRLPEPAVRDTVGQESATDEDALVHLLTRLFGEALGRPLTGDFFASGGDSLTATALLLRLRQQLGRDIPFHVLTEAPSPRALASWLGTPGAAGVDLLPDTQLEVAYRPCPRSAPGGDLLLTGATGFVGKLLLEKLLLRGEDRILCLVRCDSQEQGMQRLGVPTHPRLTVIPGDLALPHLGLGADGFVRLAARTSRVLHNGALVNFVYPYQALRQVNVEGTRTMLELAALAGASFHHVSSVAVFESAGYADVEDIDEDADIDLSHGLYDGYPQSKWVAEKLVRAAGQRGLPVSIYRPGMVSGHSETGASNAGDFIMRMIRGCVELGQAPEVDTLVELVPVDYVAEAIVRLVLRGEPGTFHLTNPTPLPAREFTELFARLGYPTQRVPYAAWRDAILAQLPQSNPLFPLLPFFASRSTAASLRLPRFGTARTQAALAPLSCPPVGVELLALSLRWLREQGFLNQPRETPR